MYVLQLCLFCWQLGDLMRGFTVVVVDIVLTLSDLSIRIGAFVLISLLIVVSLIFLLDLTMVDLLLFLIIRLYLCERHGPVLGNSGLAPLCYFKLDIKATTYNCTK